MWDPHPQVLLPALLCICQSFAFASKCFRLSVWGPPYPPVSLLLSAHFPIRVHWQCSLTSPSTVRSATWGRRKGSSLPARPKQSPVSPLPCICPAPPIRTKGPRAENQSKRQQLTRNSPPLSLLVPPSDLPARLVKSRVSSKSPFSPGHPAQAKAVPFLCLPSLLSRLLSRAPFR